MTPDYDRRAIVTLLLQRFPILKRATSDEVGEFLNAETGLDIRPDVPNSTAFDQWRRALAGAGVAGVWTETPAERGAAKARGQQIKAAHDRGETELPR